MNRRDFAKTTATGLGGLLAMLVPGKVKAKGEPKPEFPRYFVHRDGFKPPLVYVQWRSPNVLAFVQADGKDWPIKSSWLDNNRPKDSLVRTCREIGYWDEVTAAEAEALLKAKPEFPRWFLPHEDDRWLLFGNDSVLLRADNADDVCTVSRCYDESWPTTYTLAGAQKHVTDGRWREITAAEAEALLKPKTVRLWKAACPGPSLMQEYPLGTRRWDTVTEKRLKEIQRGMGVYARMYRDLT